MPPRVKITQENIIKTAVELVRMHGAQALNARGVAAALNCSTQPIFSNFASMDDLLAATVGAAYGVYQDFIKRELESGKYPQYKAFGMAYIRFAKEEKELFKLLFMCDTTRQSFTPTQDFDASVSMIMRMNGMDKATAELLHLEMWVCVHGIATIHATSFLSLEWDLVERMLTDVYQGIRARLLTGGTDDGCH